jgi:hypothetical protein
MQLLINHHVFQKGGLIVNVKVVAGEFQTPWLLLAFTVML